MVVPRRRRWGWAEAGSGSGSPRLRLNPAEPSSQTEPLEHVHDHGPVEASDNCA